MQAAVRSRLQRLKMDLQKAQAKLQTVDQVCRLTQQQGRQLYRDLRQRHSELT